MLQDQGIKLSKPMRQKIITYQSDLGYQLLTKQVHGLIKLGMTVNHAQKRIAFTWVKDKHERVEEAGQRCEALANRHSLHRFLARWREGYAWNKHMVQLSLKAHDFRKRGEALMQMLVIANIKKVLKQERKWLSVARNDLQKFKYERVFEGWVLDTRRR